MLLQHRAAVPTPRATPHKMCVQLEIYRISPSLNIAIWKKLQKLVAFKNMEKYHAELMCADDGPKQLVRNPNQAAGRAFVGQLPGNGGRQLSEHESTTTPARSKINLVNIPHNNMSMSAGCHWYTWSKPVTHVFLPSALLLPSPAFNCTPLLWAESLQIEIIEAPPNPSRRTAKKK